jgi:hypothetical protein
VSDENGVWMRSYFIEGVTPQGDAVAMKVDAGADEVDTYPQLRASLEETASDAFGHQYRSASVTHSTWGDKWFAPFEEEGES